MWFFFGLIALTLSIVSVLILRRRYRSGGELQSLKLEDGHIAHIRLNARKSKHGAIVGYQLSVPCNFTSTFAVRRETWFDRFGKNLGITREFSLGESRLDEVLYLDSDQTIVSLMFRSESDARKALNSLFLREGNTQVLLFEKRLWLDASGNELPSGESLRDLVTNLSTIVRCLTQAKYLSSEADPFVRPATIALAISMGSAIFGALALIRLPSAPQLLAPHSMGWSAATIGSALAIGFCLLCWRMLHSSARAHRVLAELLIVGGFGAVTSTHALMRDFNSDFDQQVAVTHTIDSVRVVEESYRCGKRNRSICYRHFVALPNNTLGLSRIKLNRYEYDRLRSVDRVSVDVKPGALGWPWIEDVKGR